VQEPLYRRAPETKQCKLGGKPGDAALPDLAENLLTYKVVNCEPR